jgi:radical S-adenosyl methionine domain-containing protein 2
MLPQTINYHFINKCNANCRYCFAPKNTELTIPDQLRIIKLIAEAPLESGIDRRRINFVGGEPTLARHLPLLLETSRDLGISTSIVTNGTLLDDSVLFGHVVPLLEMIGLSVDVPCPLIHTAIGRHPAWAPMSQNEIVRIAERIHKAGVLLKLNTVVSKFNVDIDMRQFVKAIKPARWKLFQVCCLDGLNEKRTREVEIDEETFDRFVKRHRSLTRHGIMIQPESSEIMRSSYVMIAPDGRFFDSICGRYRFGRRILDVGVETAFEDVYFSLREFKHRSIAGLSYAGELS